MSQPAQRLPTLLKMASMVEEDAAAARSARPAARVARHRREVALASSLERPESGGPSAWRGLDESGETRTDRASPAAAVVVSAAAPLEQQVEDLASSAQRISINSALDLRQKADTPARPMDEPAVDGATDFVATPRGPATLRGLD